MSLFKELKRRNVIRVAIAYAVVSWVLIQIGNILFSTLELGPEPGKILLAILLLGLIPAVIFSWAFEITPEGVKKEKNVQRDDSITNITAKKLDMVIIGLMVAAIGLFGWQSMKSPTSDSVNVQNTKPATQETTSTVSKSVIAETDTEDNSIAVLPFVDMSPAKDQEYFTDGLTENLLHSLAQIREIKVAGRTSSFAFKNKNVDLREIGDTLNVQKILEGSVQKSGNQLRITAQLINVDDGFHVWSQAYDRDLVDIFSVQDEITAAVVKALRKSILGENEISHAYSGNIEAYNAYLRGRSFHSLRTLESWAKAIEQYNVALKIDPDMALAWAGLSRSISSQTGFTSNFKQGYEKARVAANRALELDPELPEALLALVDIKMGYDWDWVGAEKLLNQAMSLRPGDADIQLQLAYLLMILDKTSEAYIINSRVLSQDPLNVFMLRQRAWLLLSMKRLDEALIFSNQLIETYPNNSTLATLLAVTHRDRGEYELALKAAAKERVSYLRLTMEAISHHALGDVLAAEKKLKELIAEHGDDVSYQVAVIKASWGDVDGAFAALERGIEVNDPGVVNIQYQTGFDNVKKDPRYQLLLSKLGL